MGMTDTTTQTCQRALEPRDRFESYHPRQCGRPSVEGDPSGRCKLHIRTDEKALERAGADRRKRELIAIRSQRAEELAARVRKVADFPGVVREEYDAVIAKDRTGRVVVDPDVLEILLDLAEEARYKLHAD